MENCRHLEPKTITEELVSFCAWCGNPLQRDIKFKDNENPDNNFDEHETVRQTCDCWAFGKNYPMWIKRLYRVWLKLNNKYNKKKFREQ